MHGAVLPEQDWVFTLTHRARLCGASCAPDIPPKWRGSKTQTGPFGWSAPTKTTTHTAGPTLVCTMPTRLHRSFKIVSNTLNVGTGSLSGCSCKCRSRFCVIVCTAQKVPVRPIPALSTTRVRCKKPHETHHIASHLQCTRIDPRLSCIASTKCNRCRNVAAEEGRP